jgi:phage protein D
MSPVSPTAVDSGDFTFSITVDGKPLDDHLGVLTVDLWSALDTMSKAGIVLMTDTAPGEPFSSRALAVLEQGRVIEIRAGYRVSSDVVFSGTVVSHGVNLGADASGITVTAEGAGIHVIDPDARDPVVTVEYGVSIISFKAEAKPGKSRMPELRGEVSFQGTAVVQPGSLIELVGLGGSFDGDVFVTGVHHEIENGNWTTHVKFREPPGTGT